MQRYAVHYQVPNNDTGPVQRLDVQQQDGPMQRKKRQIPIWPAEVDYSGFRRRPASPRSMISLD
jgi:hypothetical protein